MLQCASPRSRRSTIISGVEAGLDSSISPTSSAPEHNLQHHSDPIIVSADKAIPLGLLVNELVTNAVKYAYVDGPGVIRVDAREIDGHLRVEISDEGAGLPNGFDINQPRKSLGFRVINGLVKQLMGEMKISKNMPRGTLFTVKFPLDAPSADD